MNISGTLTSSNSGWHKDWFYLKDCPEYPLPKYTGYSIAEVPANWSYGPPEADVERLLGDCFVVLAKLRNAGVDLATVIGLYHTLGVIPLQRHHLRICQMTPDRAPFVGTMCAPQPPSLDEIQHHVGRAIGKASYSWSPPQVLPMLPHEGLWRSQWGT